MKKLKNHFMVILYHKNTFMSILLLMHSFKPNFRGIRIPVDYSAGMSCLIGYLFYILNSNLSGGVQKRDFNSYKRLLELKDI